MIQGETVHSGNRPENSDHKRHFPFVRLGLAGLTAMIVAEQLYDPTETIVTAQAEAHLVAIEDPHNITIRNMQKIARGDAKDDQFANMPSPWGARFGVYERHVEYLMDGMMKKTAIDDDRIGFYVLVQETSGVNAHNFDYRRIVVTTSKPEPCPIEVKDGVMVLDPTCTPLASNLSRGVEFSDARSGLPGFENQHIGAEARLQNTRMLENKWCELALVFGVEETGGAIVLTGEESGDFNLNFDNITQETIYNGVKEGLKTSIRADGNISETSLPLTNEIGRPLELTEDDVDILEAVMKRTGKNIVDMTEEEYRREVGIEVTSRRLQDSTNTDRTIDPGPTVAWEMKQLYDSNNSYEEPKTYDDSEITEENQEFYNRNFWCLPTDPEGVEESMRLWWLRRQIGSLTGMPAFATLVPRIDTSQGITQQPELRSTDMPYSIASLDPMEAIARVNAFKISVGFEADQSGPQVTVPSARPTTTVTRTTLAGVANG